VIRPEIVVPHPGSESDGAGERPAQAEAAAGEEGTLRPGAQVRVIRDPYFGRIARVAALPPELREIETEAQVRVAEVTLESGETVVVPRANLELIEG
jgi:hypothetical protein